MGVFTHFGRYLLMIKGMSTRPEYMRMYWKEFMYQCVENGIGSRGIVSVISIFLGAVLLGERMGRTLQARQVLFPRQRGHERARIADHGELPLLEQGNERREVRMEAEPRREVRRRDRKELAFRERGAAAAVGPAGRVVRVEPAHVRFHRGVDAVRTAIEQRLGMQGDRLRFAEPGEPTK